MIISKRQNAKRNIFAGILSRAISLVLPFGVNAVFIRTLGAEYLGMNSLFSSVLSILNLAELGAGTAIIYSMYKPIAEDDKKSICALLNLYKILYQRIGWIIFFAGLLLIPFLPRLVRGAYPDDIHISLVYLIFLMRTVLSYWMSAYKRALFTAFQRTDAVSAAESAVNVISYIMQAFLLFLRNYYLYLLILVLQTVFQNVLIEYKSRCLFPEYISEGKISASQRREIVQNVKGLFISKVSGATRNAFDNIFMSAFIGLAATAVYNNYYLVINSLLSILWVFTHALQGGIGNDIATKSPQENYNGMRTLNFAFMMISGAMTVFLSVLYQPFMQIWMGKHIFSDYIAWLFSGYFFLLSTGAARCLYSDGKGLFWETRYQSVFEGIANITLNYLLGKYFGAAGIVSATMISLTVFSFYAIYLLFQHYFKTGMLQFIGDQIFMTMITMGLCVIANAVCNQIAIQGFLGLIVRSVICMLVILFSGILLIKFNKDIDTTCLWIWHQILDK